MVPYWGGGVGHTMVSSASLPIDEVYTFGWRGIYATLISLRVWFGDQRSDMQGCARNVQSDGSFIWGGINQALDWDFWLIWWTPFDQFGSQWHGVTFIRKWVKQEIHKTIDRIPWKGFCDWIGTPKKHYIIWCLGTIQVPLIGITDAVSMVLWLGLLVRVLAIIAKCADCHAIHIQINTWIEYFYPGQKIFRSKYQWNISIQDKNIQINTQIEYSYSGQKIFRSKHNLNISIQYKRYSDQQQL